MTEVITVTYDGKVLTPKTPLDLETNQEYQIQIISDYNQCSIINELKTSADLSAEIYQPKKRSTPAHLKGKVKILGDIVSPIVHEEDWECLK